MAGRTSRADPSHSSPWSAHSRTSCSGMLSGPGSRGPTSRKRALGWRALSWAQARAYSRTPFSFSKREMHRKTGAPLTAGTTGGAGAKCSRSTPEPLVRTIFCFFRRDQAELEEDVPVVGVLKEDGPVGGQPQPVEAAHQGAEQGSAPAALSEGVAQAGDHGGDVFHPGGPGGQGAPDHGLDRVGEDNVRTATADNGVEPGQAGQVPGRVQGSPADRSGHILGPQLPDTLQHGLVRVGLRAPWPGLRALPPPSP